MSAKKNDPVTEGDAGLKRLDSAFRRVLSVSNKSVREKMAAEKRERTPCGQKPKR